MKYKRIKRAEAMTLLAGQPEHQAAVSWSPVIYKLTRHNADTPFAVFGVFAITALAQEREVWLAALTLFVRSDALGLMRAFHAFAALAPALTARTKTARPLDCALARRLGFTLTHTIAGIEYHKWQK